MTHHSIPLELPLPVKQDLTGSFEGMKYYQSISPDQPVVICGHNAEFCHIDTNTGI